MRLSPGGVPGDSRTALEGRWQHLLLFGVRGSRGRSFLEASAHVQKLARWYLSLLGDSRESGHLLLTINVLAGLHRDSNVFESYSIITFEETFTQV